MVVKGAIGYGIRPSQRRKEYASVMLQKFLERIKEQGYDKVLMTCDDDNIGSMKTIEKNGGILYDTPIVKGVVRRRYWVTLTE